MSCQICKRGACARWMHSLEDQERFDERETMSDDVDELRHTIQGLRDEIRELTTDNEQMREALKRVMRCTATLHVKTLCDAKENMRSAWIAARTALEPLANNAGDERQSPHNPRP